jgi:hypothetical protein
MWVAFNLLKVNYHVLYLYIQYFVPTGFWGEVQIMYSRVQRVHQICETEAAIATHSESKTKVEFKDK